LSSRGQGLECFFKVLAMVFLAVLADVIGRKPVLVMGLVCTGISAVCFLVATASPAWLAFSLFALGQGLQGAYPAELLTAVVANDISSEKESDLLVVQQVSTVLGTINIFLTECIGAWLKSSNSTDFRATWVLVVMGNAFMALWAWACLRETKPKFDVDRTGNGVIQGVQDELREYWMLLRTKRMVRLNLLMAACFAAFFTGTSTDISFYMSYYGISQTSAALHFFWRFPVGIACFGIAEGICKRFGYPKGYLVTALIWVSLDVIFMPFFLMGPIVFLLHQYFLLFGTGMNVITGMINARWFDQRLTSKYLAMKTLT